MIAKIIELSVRNRLMVLLLTVFLVAAGIWATVHIGLDAIPDLSDVQVIIVTDYPGQAPDVVESQVTYPLTTKMMGIPRAKIVRGQSMFELSFVYIIFEDGTDLYWARSRVLEYLNSVRSQLPVGVEPRLGPDATGVGWAYQYVLNPGYYCPAHPKGIWHDAQNDKWYAQLRGAPTDRQAELIKVRAMDHPGVCPLDGKPLVSSNQNLATLRSLQDWYLRYQLTAVPNVSEVASIGGFVKEYQVVLNPQRLLGYKLGVKDIVSAIQRSNHDVGGSVVEMSENEYMVRSRGYFGTPHGGKAGNAIDDLARVTVGVNPESATPILLGDIATLQIAGQERRGVGEWNGEGEAVGGVIVARYGANANQVIQDAKAKLAELENGLPPGVTIKTAYDRSDLIERSIHTLKHTLLEEMIVVSLVCIFFLLHGRSALVAIFVIPSSMLVSLLVMYAMGINANIMSLGGIAIAIGVVVDSAIVMVENAHKHLAHEDARVHAGGEPRPHLDIIIDAAQEVGPSLFFSLLIITVSFLPIFGLVGEEGRLFRPLAFTKTFAIGSASVLSITIVPVLMSYFIGTRVLPNTWRRLTNIAITLGMIVLPAVVLLLLAAAYPALASYRWWLAGGWALLLAMLLLPQKVIHEERNPISHALQKAYEPFFWGAMKFRWPVMILAVAFIASAAWPYLHIGSELMPPLDEGDLLYMPTTDPSISVTEARQIIQQTDRLIKTFPEVVSVYGKIGRAETATDPAPLDMVETVVRLQTDPTQWRRRKMHYWFDRAPDWLTWPLHHTVWPAQQLITMDELVYGWQEADGTKHPGMNEVASIPGVANTWTMPIANRTNMLSTGIKTPVGIKIMGPDLQVLSDLAQKASILMRSVSGTTSAYAERTLGGYYLDIDPKPAQIARYGLNTGDVQDVIETAIGGIQIGTTVEGLERYPVNVRYARDLRNDPYRIKQILVPVSTGAQVPIGQLVDVTIQPGPPMIRSEDTRTSTWVFVDMSGRDLGSYMADAQKMIAEQLPMPDGYTLAWSGQYEIIQQNSTRWKVAGLIALVTIILLLYASSRSWLRTLIVLLTVPFSVAGAIWFLWLLGYNWSGAVIVGLIALAGLAAEIGIVMLLYLDNSYERFKAAGRMNTDQHLLDAVHEGAVKRIRPMTMTVAAAFIGLVPLMWASGAGADVMRRIAAPMIGGLFTGFLMGLLIYPVIFYVAKSVGSRRGRNRTEPQHAPLVASPGTQTGGGLHE
jgi:Cu(I)/Ag(I) efflux system membrane protein CusA/SilA